MSDSDLIRALRRIKVETGSLVCLGCGHEHNCSTHGCAVINEAIARLEVDKNTTLGGTYVSVEWFEHVETELKKYKATGLEPEEITTEPYGCVFYCNRKCNLDGDFCAEGPGCPRAINSETAKHLLELSQAEKDGRLVVLPCKVGDTVYITYGEGYKPCVVDRIHIIANNQVQVRLRCFCTETLWLSASDFGKTVFLTHEEAEAALKK